MGLDLMDSFPTYLQSIRNMDRALKSLTEAPSWTIEGRSLLSLLRRERKSDGEFQLRCMHPRNRAWSSKQLCLSHLSRLFKLLWLTCSRRGTSNLLSLSAIRQVRHSNDIRIFQLHLTKSEIRGDSSDLRFRALERCRSHRGCIRSWSRSLQKHEERGYDSCWRR